MYFLRFGISYHLNLSLNSVLDRMYPLERIQFLQQLCKLHVFLYLPLVESLRWSAVINWMTVILQFKILSGEYFVFSKYSSIHFLFTAYSAEI